MPRVAYNKSKIMGRAQRLKRIFELKRYAAWSARTRIIAASGALLLVMSISLPLVVQAVQSHRYAIEPDAQHMLGSVVGSLNKKLSYDSNRKMYQFNKDGESNNDSSYNPTNQVQQKALGANRSDNAHLYSVDLPTNLSSGVRYYDNQQGVSFMLTPEFQTSTGQMSDGHLVYPLKDTAGQAVYTIQNNGLREDVIVNSAAKTGTLSLGYHLELPDTLEARAIPGTGAIGIYSADPTLFGNISYGSSADQALVMQARVNGAKNYLVFTIPAPVVAQDTTKGIAPKTNMTLTNNSDVKITVSGLDKKASYPLDIDPSVVINSSGTFDNGNEEGNIDVGTAVSRGALTGGTISAGWTAGNQFTTGRQMQGTVVSNGFLYVVGGTSGSAIQDVRFVALNSNGSLGTWASTTAYTLSARYGQATVAYNGYLYILGGYDGTTYYSTAQYAKLNSDGTISSGAWQTATSLTAAGYGFGATAYNGHLYILGGYNGTTYDAHTYYTTINGDGTLSAWTTSGNTFTNGRYRMGATAYNGYLYISGGTSATVYADTQYAQINSDGSIGAWIATTSFTNARYGLGFTSENGYLYVVGGYNNTTYLADMQYASINMNGSISAWTTSGTALATGRYGQTTVAYNNYLYTLGGNNAATYYSDAYYAHIDSAGTPNTWTTTTAFTTARQNFGSAVYNGFLYVAGGVTTIQISTIYFAPISATGTIGTWSLTTSLTTPRSGIGLVAYQGFMYALGGYDGTSYLGTTQYSTISATGTLGGWTTGTAFTGTAGLRAYLGVTAYNGYLYVMGGSNTTNHYNTVYESAIASSGLNGAWTATTSFTTGRDGMGVAVYGGRVYIIGGNTGAGEKNDVQYATFTTSGALSSWSTASTTFTTARDKLMAGVFNGCLYIMGGIDAVGTFHNDVQYAQIQSSGDVGAWTTSAYTFATTRYGGGGLAYNGYLYVFGGIDSGSTLHNDVQYTQINSGGPGTVGTWTSSANTFTNGRYDHGSFAYNGNLYVIGGFDGTTYWTTVANNAIMYAPISNNGSLGTWVTSATALTKGRKEFGLATYNGFLYITGGNAGGAAYTDTQYIAISAITSTSVAGTWTTGTPVLANAASGIAETAYNGYLYAMGGTGTSYFTTVNYAVISANGSVGAWNTTTALPSGRYDFAIAAYSGYMYVVGGTNDTVIDSDVFYAAINSGNGTLAASWTYGPSLPIPRTNFELHAQNGYMYVMGGYLGGTSYSGDVSSTSIGASGSLGTWSTTTAFPTPRAGTKTALYNGFLYVTGGADNTNNYATTHYAPVNAIARTGAYSQMIDLGAPATILSTLTYTGTVSTLSYESAGSNAIFGSSTSASSLNTTTCGYNQGTVRYVFIFVTFDDSQTGTFVGDTPSSVTNITLNYLYGRAPTNARLHGGKYFSAQTQMPLDTCGP